MTLGELIDILTAMPPGATVALGKPNSYRGDYAELAFAPGEPRPATEVLADARACVGALFDGYKGGIYRMGLGTVVHRARWGEYGGFDDALTPAFFGIKSNDELRAELERCGAEVLALTKERDAALTRCVNLEAEGVDDERLRERLHELLRGVAIGLFGPEPELVRYDLSHLPRIAAEVRAAGIEVDGEHPDRHPVNRRAEELKAEAEGARELAAGFEQQVAALTIERDEWREHAMAMRRECVATGDAGEAAIKVAKGIKEQRDRTAAQLDATTAALSAAVDRLAEVSNYIGPFGTHQQMFNLLTETIKQARAVLASRGGP